MDDPHPSDAKPAAAGASRPLFDRVVDFINNMDARAWRALAVTVGLFLVTGVMLVVGRLFYGEQIEAFIDTWLGGAERAHLGLPATILIFTMTAYVGTPQFVLIAACVVAFGPEVGFWYAWAATIVSGAVTYATGRLSGAETRKRFGGATGGRFTRFMGKNAFLASFAVRFVPTAPFIVVNMAFGAARVSFWGFMGGLTVGVLPKTAIIAFAGDGIMDALEGNLGSAALMGGIAIVLWFFVVLGFRRWLLKKADERENDDKAGSL
ncbi:MAG: VTT domain-containing protein [Hyphomonadaceae bacterium]|nr:VTT domain-containing protein [Hyphomonadaceae bacterium]